MIKAAYSDKDLVVDILTRSFETNPSVNYLVRQDEQKRKRISALMDYSFGVCFLFGDVYLSADQKACALVLYPDQKKTNFQFILLNVKLILKCIGLGNNHKLDLTYRLYFLRYGFDFKGSQ